MFEAGRLPIIWVVYSAVYFPIQELGMAYLHEAFQRAVESNASSIAVIEDTNRWTFADLSNEADRIAAVLKQQVKGDAVGVLLLNSQKYVATMLGIWKAGKIAVPL